MRQRFVKESVIEASAERVFAFHEEPDALERLQPPWPPAVVEQPPASLEVGSRVVLKLKLGPFSQRIVAEHVAYEPGRRFADRMVEGPFPYWLHEHRVTSLGPERCTLTDDITYELPLGFVGRLFGSWIARGLLERMFGFRHRVTREACEAPASGRPS